LELLSLPHVLFTEKLHLSVWQEVPELLQSLLGYPQETMDFIFIVQEIFGAKAVRRPVIIITQGPHRHMVALLAQKESGTQGISETSLLRSPGIPFS
jgi:hypothetical protein